MNDIRVVAFDCDGVMFDTLDANVSYYNGILEHLDRPPMTPEQIAYTQMHTVHESLRHICDHDGTLVAKADAFRKIRGYMPYIRKMKPEPHLRRLLAVLRPEYKTAIATNRTDTMQRVLSDFDLAGLFDLVVCASDVERPKPHPDQLNLIAGHFDAEPEQILFIGDSELDQAAAESAGVHFLAFNNPSLSAGRHIASLSEVETLLSTAFRAAG